MRINQNRIGHWIDNFFGYGSWEARFWFIGNEEDGGNTPEEVAGKLDYFKETHPTLEPTLCDIRKLYKNVVIKPDGPRADLFNNLFDYRFGANAVQHSIWKNLTLFISGYDDQAAPDFSASQKKLFASPAKPKEALIPLYPLPSPHNHAWYYSWLDLPQLDFLRSRALYHEHVYEHRMQTILRQIGQYKPEVVIMYGMDNINSLKDSVKKNFPDAKFKMVKAIPRKIPQHHIAILNETKLLITTQVPALRHNRIESGFDWEMLGKLVKG